MGARASNRSGALGRPVIFAAVVGAFAALLFAAPVTHATHFDPRQPTTIVVGPSPGIAPMARVDGGRSGRAHQPLPSHPKIVWRHSSRGSLDFVALAVDSAGAVLVPSATLTELLELASDGSETWRASTGVGPSVSGAVLLNDRTRLVATSAGEAVGFSADGRIRFTTPLDLEERNAKLGILPLDDGGAAISSGHEIHEIDDDGRLRQTIHLSERPAGPLVATLGGTVATSSSGTVYLVKTGHAERLGTLGGDPSEAGASTPDGRRLWAVVDHQKLVSLDLATGALRVHFSVADQSLHGPVVFGPDASLVVTTWTGVLLVIAPSGEELRRTALEPRFATLITDAGQVDFAALDESPSPLVDVDGRIAFARVGGRIGVVARDGGVRLVPLPTCNSPAALAPAGRERMVVGCRDGTVLMIGEEKL